MICDARSDEVVHLAVEVDRAREGGERLVGVGAARAKSIGHRHATTLEAAADAAERGCPSAADRVRPRCYLRDVL